MLLLRAMKQAVYDVVNIGHFGLAGPAHSDPPLAHPALPGPPVHRAVRCAARAIARDERNETLRAAATTASECERKAMEIEREVVDLHRAPDAPARGPHLRGHGDGLVGTGVVVNWSIDPSSTCW